MRDVGVFRLCRFLGVRLEGVRGVGDEIIFFMSSLSSVSIRGDIANVVFLGVTFRPRPFEGVVGTGLRSHQVELESSISLLPLRLDSRRFPFLFFFPFLLLLSTAFFVFSLPESMLLLLALAVSILFLLSPDVSMLFLLILIASILFLLSAAILFDVSILLLLSAATL